MRNAPEAVQSAAGGQENGSGNDDYDRLVAQVRQDKRSRLMDDWMRSARKRYTVTLNPVFWQRIGSRGQAKMETGAARRDR
jgi:hypothetical protein